MEFFGFGKLACFFIQALFIDVAERDHIAQVACLVDIAGTFPSHPDARKSKPLIGAPNTAGKECESKCGSSGGRNELPSRIMSDEFRAQKALPEVDRFPGCGREDVRETR